MKSFLAISKLINQGFVEDANILLRAMFEILVTTLFIKQNPEKRAIKYLEFSHIEKYRLIKVLPHPNSYLEYDAKRIEEIKRDYFRVEKNYKNKSSWSQHNIREMAQKVGLQDVYDLVYRFQSQFVHTTPEGMQSYISKIPTGFLINLEPKNIGFYLGITSGACETLLGVIKILDDTFNLGRSKEIDDLKEELHSLFAGGKK